MGAPYRSADPPQPAPRPWRGELIAHALLTVAYTAAVMAAVFTTLRAAPTAGALVLVAACLRRAHAPARRAIDRAAPRLACAWNAHDLRLHGDAVPDATPSRCWRRYANAVCAACGTYAHRCAPCRCCCYWDHERHVAR